MGIDENYKRAVIKFTNKVGPELITAMNELARAIRNMPRSQKMRH